MWTAEQFLQEIGLPVRQTYAPGSLAQHLGGSRRAWQRACARGEIAATLTRHGYRITRADLLVYVASNSPAIKAGGGNLK